MIPSPLTLFELHYDGLLAVIDLPLFIVSCFEVERPLLSTGYLRLGLRVSYYVLSPGNGGRWQ